MVTGSDDYYDELTTHVRENAEAEAVILIVLKGNRGSGFAVHAPKEALEELPDLLELASAEIRKTLAS